MDTFPMTYFKFETKYPESSTKVQLGKNWTFTAPPNAPDQKIFTLTFTGLKYYVDDAGELDDTTDANTKNMLTLQLFYESVRTYAKFNFYHPVYGLLVCQFNKPLLIPKGISGGFGALEDFTVELLEIP